MATPLPTYAFLSWVRQGLATAIGMPDSTTSPPPGVATLTASVQADGENVQVTLRVHGPGDVRGIDPRLIVRTDPVDGATGCEPNYFPYVEFGRADLPWLFTPAAAAGQRLRPWICLVVVPRAAATGPVSRPSAPLPVLTVDAAELPDLADVSATAHAQVTWLPGSQPTDQELTTLIETGSPAAVSRLLCFRRLDAHVRYLACVVPTFDLGRKAGLGLEVTDTDERALLPAWTASTGSVKLPALCSWEFETGDEGDFESLRRRLEHTASPLGPDAGQRSMDVSQPGYGMPDAGGPLSLPGALQPRGFSSPPWQGSAHDQFQAALRALLNRTAASPIPLVVPPIYGAWPAGQVVVPAPGGAPVWLAELNLDPRYRVAASFGAAVVHREQEQLMASAWDQLAHLRHANQLLRQAQFAHAVASAVQRAHLAPLAPTPSDSAPGRLLQVTRPLHGRLLIANVTLTHQIAASAIPDGAVSPTLRRMASPQSALARRLTADGGRMPALVDRLNAGARVAPAWKEPNGTVLAARVTAAAGPTFADVRLDAATAGALTTAAGWQRTTSALMARALLPDRNGDVDWGDTFDNRIPKPPSFQNLSDADFLAMQRNFRAAASRHQSYLQQLAGLPLEPAPNPQLRLTAQTVLGALDPTPSVQASVRERLGAPPPPQLDPLTAAPIFPQAMLEPLVELSPQLVLPGLEHVPDESLLLMDVNYRFLEAYLIGLNHEMGRELLWRGFPTVKGATFFRRFWSWTSERGDIPAIANWDPAQALGRNAAAWAMASPLVLVVRSALLRRYPSASIYAQDATLQNGRRVPGGAVHQPVFRGQFGDTQVFGFDLTLAAALGVQPYLQGCFIILEQHAQEPRFGLPAANRNNTLNPQAWDQVSWSSLVAQDEDLRALRYASMTWRPGGAPSRPLTAGGPTLTWGADAAQMASICLRNPARVAIHASALLAPGG